MGRQQITPLPSAVLPAADGEALLPKDETFNASNTADFALMYEAPTKKAITSVPDWLYTEQGFLGTSKAATLWFMNLICMLSHTFLLILSMATDALIPAYERAGGIPLPALVIMFFGLSALAHGTVVVFNRKQAFATGFMVHEFSPEDAKLTTWTGHYYLWMHQCRNPLRWIEYSFSAGFMAVVFSVAGGLNHVYMIWMIFALIWCTMCFGHFSEVICPPKDLGDNTRPMYWLINDANPHLLWVPGLNGRFHRLIPHVLGYVPYLFVWVILLHSFFYNTGNAPEGGGPPAFVYIIVIGQFVAFSLFGITQFVLLWREDGARQFYLGEVSYQFLSLFAKTLLGGVLIGNVLLFSSFDEAVQKA